MWRGWLGTWLNNGHRYRLAAGRDLAVQLHAQCVEHPRARHFVVAHSHGGNVTLYALRMPGLPRRLAGVVCLGTPFLQCEPRDTDRAVTTYGDLLLATPSLALLVLLALFVFPSAYFAPDQTILFEGYGYRVTPLSLLALLAVLLAFVYYPRANRRVGAWLIEWTRKRKWATFDRLALPRAQGDWPPILVATARGDEAGRLLSWLRRAADAPYWVWTGAVYAALFWLVAGSTLIWPNLLPDILRDPYGYSRDFAARLWPAASAWQPTSEWERRWDALLRWEPLWRLVGAVAGGLSVVLAVLWLHLTALALVPRVVRAHALGYGQETIWDNLLVRIHVASMPPGLEGIERSYVVVGRSLHHSGLYNDPQVLQDVGEWIRIHVSHSAGPR